MLSINDIFTFSISFHYHRYSREIDGPVSMIKVFSSDKELHLRRVSLVAFNGGEMLVLKTGNNSHRRLWSEVLPLLAVNSNPGRSGNYRSFRISTGFLHTKDIACVIFS